MREEGYLIGKGGKLLHGHVSAETAYVQQDYPYGRELRCKRRCWVETASGGQKNNQQRAVYQTSNPKVEAKEVNGLIWNKPHPDVYYAQVLLLIDASGKDHVHSWGVSAHCGPEDHAWFKATGLFEQMSASDVRRFTTIAEASKKYNKGTWREWAEVCRAFCGRVDAGHGPDAVAASMTGLQWEYPHPTLGTSDVTAYPSTVKAVAALWGHRPEYVREYAGEALAAK